MILFGILVMSLAFTAVDSFTISAFNVQIFGVSKMDKPEVVDILTKIIQRHDIVLVQEIRDSSGESIYELLDKVNALGPSEYDLVISDRLGRSSSKEQYAFLYRTNTGVAVEDFFQYPDTEDAFEREPFAVRFSSKYTVVEDFVLAGIHTSPDSAVEEINHLDDVHDELKSHWNTDNIMIMGDFNSDCDYVTEKDMGTLEFRTDEYVWLIGDEADTTTKSTDCAYDRFVVTGELVTGVVENSARVFRFDLEYNLSTEMTHEVSDHYPIEVDLKMKDGSQKTEL